MYDFMYRVYTLHTASHVLVTKGCEEAKMKMTFHYRGGRA